MRGLRILFLTPRFPYPLIGGDRIKSYNLLRHLARHNEVFLVTFNHGKEPSEEQIRSLEDLGVHVYPVVLQPARAALRSIKSVYTDLPLEISFYTQPEFSSTVENLLRTVHFDLGISFFMRTAEYLKDVPIKKVLVAEDCRVLYQTRSMRSSSNLAQHAVRWWEVRKLKRYEPEIVKHFDMTTMVTDTDINALACNNGGVKYGLLTNGVDLGEFHFRDEHEQRRDILFFGKLDVWANHLMVSRIAESILPKVRKQLKDVKCNIVGSNPKQLVHRYESDAIHFIPNVPDIKDYVYKSAIFLHPHLGASGIQNKVLQAMALGCPVVSTPTGIQGIDAVPGRDVLIGHTDEELAGHCIDLLRNPELRSKLARNARMVVECHHSWELIFQQMDDIIDRVLNNNAEVRKLEQASPQNS